MVTRSRGLRSKTRHKMQATVRPGRTNIITKKIQRFEEDDFVHIIIDPSFHKGQPHPRFHGKTAKIIGTIGRAYVVGLKDGNKSKELIIRTEHLKAQE